MCCIFKTIQVINRKMGDIHWLKEENERLKNVTNQEEEEVEKVLNNIISGPSAT